MLTLPDNWPFMTHGAIAEHLQGQLSSRESRSRFLRCYFWSVLDVGNAVKAEHVPIVEDPICVWREKHMSYRIVRPRDQIETLQALVRPNLWFVTGVKDERRVTKAIRATGANDVHVSSLPGFVKVRMFFTMLAGRWCHSECVRSFYDSFNRRTQDLNSQSLAVQLPWSNWNGS